MPEAARRFIIGAAARGHQVPDGLLARAAGASANIEGDNGHDHDADDQQETGGEAEAEVPGPRVHTTLPAAPIPDPPAAHAAPRPRARGVRHPPVPTKAQVERHALEQHVNYEPWCEHCQRASALMKQHLLVSGDSPSVPTISADFCFMKCREADAGDSIPVLVMRDSQKRGRCSRMPAQARARPRKGTRATLLENVWKTSIACTRTCT